MTGPEAPAAAWHMAPTVPTGGQHDAPTLVSVVVLLHCGARDYVQNYWLKAFGYVRIALSMTLRVPTVLYVFGTSQQVQMFHCVRQEVWIVEERWTMMKQTSCQRHLRQETGKSVCGCVLWVSSLHQGETLAHDAK